jgi:hypothetical protein
MRPLTIVIAVLLGVTTLAQQPQNPSPLVEHTRAHPRLAEASSLGRREPLEIGTLFVPAAVKRSPVLVVHFHGSTWLPEVAAARVGGIAVITVQLGSGSAVYARPFLDRALYTRLIAEAEAKAGMTFPRIALASWSAGYGAVREILRVPEHDAPVERVLLIDGLHTDYVEGRPGTGPALESRLGRG